MLDLTKQSSERKVNRKKTSLLLKIRFLLNIMTFYFVSKAF